MRITNLHVRGNLRVDGTLTVLASYSVNKPWNTPQHFQRGFFNVDLLDPPNQSNLTLELNLEPTEMIVALLGVAHHIGENRWLNFNHPSINGCWVQNGSNADIKWMLGVVDEIRLVIEIIVP